MWNVKGRSAVALHLTNGEAVPHRDRRARHPHGHAPTLSGGRPPAPPRRRTSGRSRTGSRPSTRRAQERSVERARRVGRGRWSSSSIRARPNRDFVDSRRGGSPLAPAARSAGRLEKGCSHTRCVPVMTIGTTGALQLRAIRWAPAAKAVSMPRIDACGNTTTSERSAMAVSASARTRRRSPIDGVVGSRMWPPVRRTRPNAGQVKSSSRAMNRMGRPRRISSGTSKNPSCSENTTAGPLGRCSVPTNSTSTRSTRMTSLDHTAWIQASGRHASSRPRIENATDAMETSTGAASATRSHSVREATSNRPRRGHVVSMP